jgi:hypothetical protein
LHGSFLKEQLFFRYGPNIFKTGKGIFTGGAAGADGQVVDGDDGVGAEHDQLV